ncbi:hypothetical protein HFP51_07555 [Parasphingopyxis sp. CP4]|uniref:hypothetical protein n=1 Tax=Parasphingopyxis sp. CP4 TaxID=2724527 RepID=UPI0015A1D6D4|nr:hypothetical protein [Parasphingopyxis sp. CP4]QLC22048.1 hypothetical protein HFP51_07555 [Parasphingopyxis sp. CP4]
MKITPLLLSLALAVPASASAQSTDAANDVTIPDVVEFGASLETMTERLSDHCPEWNIRTIDPPFMPDVQEIQQQLDCNGFAYMGEPRFAEFVFRDGVLEMIWMMVDADDEDRIIAAMRAAYETEGLYFEGSEQAPRIIGFQDHNTAWRFEPPEVLFYSEAMAPALEASVQPSSAAE